MQNTQTPVRRMDRERAFGAGVQPYVKLDPPPLFAGSYAQNRPTQPQPSKSLALATANAAFQSSFSIKPAV